MKRVDAVIQPVAWEQTREVLERLHVSATLREVKTFGRTPPRREVYRGTAYYSNLTPEIELTALVEDDRLEATLSALQGLVDGGELLVTAVEGVLHRAEAPRAAPVAAPAPERANVALPTAWPRHA